MVNLTVDEAHTYFIADGDWLVHNANCPNWGMSKPNVTHPELASIVDADYRPSSTVGNGSTSDAILHEHQTGSQVKGREHLKKGKDLLREYRTYIQRQQNTYPVENRASVSDIQTAVQLHNQMLSTLKSVTTSYEHVSPQPSYTAHPKNPWDDEE